MAKKKKPSQTTVSGNSTLGDHARQGTRLTPPLAQLPSMSLQSWKDDRLPEMLWAVLLASQFEQRTALKIMAHAVELLGELRAEKMVGDPEPQKVSVDCDVTHTGLSEMDESVGRSFISRLAVLPESREALRPLLLLHDLPARSLWESAIGQPPRTQDWEVLMEAVVLTLDHQSQESTDCRYTRLMAAIIGGRMHFFEEMSHVLEGFKNYPSGDLHRVRPSIRSAESFLSGMLSSPSETPQPGWSAAFWQQCLRDTSCVPLPERAPEASSPPVAGTTPAQLQKVKTALLQHAEQCRTTTAVDARHDTTFGVALYSITILEELLRIGAGGSVLGRMGLRSLVDNVITLAYLAFKDDPELWKSYRVFGAGQAKLQYLKLDGESDKPLYVKEETLKGLANEDVWEEFLSVELGHWEKTNTRKMSEDAGVKDFYDRYYGWTSTFSHGHWGALRDTVFDTCGNPLHRLHRIPRSTARSLPDVVPDAALCLDRILESVSHCYPDFPMRVSL